MLTTALHIQTGVGNAADPADLHAVHDRVQRYYAAGRYAHHRAPARMHRAELYYGSRPCPAADLAVRLPLLKHADRQPVGYADTDHRREGHEPRQKQDHAKGKDGGSRLV